MDQNDIDKLLKQKAKNENSNPSEIVKKRIDQTLEELPEQRKKQRFFLSSTSIKLWSTGLACIVFFLVVYFQFNEPSFTPPPSQNAEMNITDTFDYNEAPVDKKELEVLVADELSAQYSVEISKIEINNMKLLTAIKQTNHSIVLINFEMDYPNFFALIEVKEEKEGYTNQLLSLNSHLENNSNYSHWYNEAEGIGYGYGDKYTEQVNIKTKNKQFISYLHDEYYIYLSNEKPVEVTFINENDMVMRTMETFNFDEVYPLISKDEGKYRLYVVDESESFNFEILDEEGIRGVTSGTRTSSLEDANQQYKFLELEKSPAYVVFDDEEMIYKTYNQEDLLEFLKEETE